MNGRLHSTPLHSTHASVITHTFLAIENAALLIRIREDIDKAFDLTKRVYRLIATILDLESIYQNCYLQNLDRPAFLLRLNIAE